MRRIQTERAPTPGGHYAQGVMHSGMLFVSGQLPIDPSTGEPVTGSMEAQARQVLANVLAIVNAAGGDGSHVLKTTAYITDIDRWAEVDAAYAEMFGLYRPARAVVPVKELHHGFAIEVEAVAAIPGV